MVIAENCRFSPGRKCRRLTDRSIKLQKVQIHQCSFIREMNLQFSAITLRMHFFHILHAYLRLILCLLEHFRYRFRTRYKSNTKTGPVYILYKQYYFFFYLWDNILDQQSIQAHFIACGSATLRYSLQMFTDGFASGNSVFSNVSSVF